MNYETVPRDLKTSKNKPLEILTGVCPSQKGPVNVSVNCKPDHPPGHPRGFAHSSCPWGRVLSPLSWPGVLNQSKSLIILKKVGFGLSLKQMGSSSFHMF